MIKKSVQEIKFTSDTGREGKSVVYKKGMPIVRCLCGCKILVVPDLKAMSMAIKNHVTEHKRAVGSLEQYLTEQVLIVASKMDLPNVSY